MTVSLDKEKYVDFMVFGELFPNIVTKKDSDLSALSLAFQVYEGCTRFKVEEAEQNIRNKIITHFNVKRAAVENREIDAIVGKVDEQSLVRPSSFFGKMLCDTLPQDRHESKIYEVVDKIRNSKYIKLDLDEEVNNLKKYDRGMQAVISLHICLMEASCIVPGTESLHEGESGPIIKCTSKYKDVVTKDYQISADQYFDRKKLTGMLNAISETVGDLNSTNFYYNEKTKHVYDFSAYNLRKFDDLVEIIRSSFDGIMPVSENQQSVYGNNYPQLRDMKRFANYDTLVESPSGIDLPQGEGVTMLDQLKAMIYNSKYKYADAKLYIDESSMGPLREIVEVLEAVRKKPSIGTHLGMPSDNGTIDFEDKKVGMDFKSIEKAIEKAEKAIATYNDAGCIEAFGKITKVLKSSLLYNYGVNVKDNLEHGHMVEFDDEDKDVENLLRFKRTVMNNKPAFEITLDPKLLVQEARNKLKENKFIFNKTPNEDNIRNTRNEVLDEVYNKLKKSAYMEDCQLIKGTSSITVVNPPEYLKPIFENLAPKVNLASALDQLDKKITGGIKPVIKKVGEKKYDITINNPTRIQPKELTTFYQELETIVKQNYTVEKAKMFQNQHYKIEGASEALADDFQRFLKRKQASVA